jgi:Zn-dependent M28 family amino/carboxypeptidase
VGGPSDRTAIAGAGAALRTRGTLSDSRLRGDARSGGDHIQLPGGAAAADTESYYTAIGEPYEDTEFSGRSDYEALILAGIPSGGLFTGAEDIKTAEQEAI